MKKIIQLLALNLMVCVAPQAATLLTESFDTDGEGSRYLSSTYVDGEDFIERTGSNPHPNHAGGLTFTSPQGGSYWASEDIEDSNNPLGTHAITRLADLPVAGKNNLQVRVFLAQVADKFDIQDVLEIQYAFDGSSGGISGSANPTLNNGVYTTVGRFIGNGGDIFADAAMKLDSDLDGVVFGDPGDAFSPSLSATMQEFIFDIPVTGNLLSVQVRIEQNGGTEELAFDHIRITGEDAVTQAPVLANTEVTPIAYQEGDPAVQISSTITVSDSDSATLNGGVVQITGGVLSEDALGASGSGAVSVAGVGTSMLTLSGSGTVADYQTTLRSVTYLNSNNSNPSAATRTVSFRISDGTDNSNTQTRDIQVIGLISSGTIPHLEDLNTDGEGVRYTSSTFNAGGGDFFERSDANPHPDHSGVVFFTPPQGGGFWASEDVASSGNPLTDHAILRLQNLDSSGLSSLQVHLYLAELAPTGEGSNDKIEIQYAFDGDLPSNPTDLSLGNYAAIGRFVPSSPDIFTTGAMTLDRDLDGVTFGDADDAPVATLSPTMQEFTFDIPATGNTLSVQIRIEQNGGNEELAFDRVQVTGVVAAGDSPVLVNIEGSALSYSEGDGATPVTSTLTVSDPDSTDLMGATIRIISGNVSTEDVLASTGLPAGITADPYNPGTGTLTLTGAASLADYQTALRAVSYQNSNVANPATATRTVSFQVVDTDSNPSNFQTRDVQVTPVIGSGTIPHLEDFDVDNDGVRYTSSSYEMGADFFARTDANPHPEHGGAFTFTSPQGGGFWASEDIGSSGNPLGNHGIARIFDLDATGFSDLKVHLYLAQIGEAFDLNDKIEIQYAFDGDRGGQDLTVGAYTTIGRFVGGGADIFSNGPMRQDMNLDGSVADDVGSPVLTSTLTEFTFDIPATGTTLSVQVRLEQNGGSEELAFDHLRVEGTPAVVTPPDANDDVVDRHPTQSIKIPVATLLANDTDPDGNTPLTITGVSYTSGNGADVFLSGDIVFYDPQGWTAIDTFDYTVENSLGASSTAQVTVNPVQANGPTVNVTLVELPGDGTAVITAAGIPGRAYRVLFSDDFGPWTWTLLPGGPVVADGLGQISFTDPGPLPAMRVYQIIHP